MSVPKLRFPEFGGEWGEFKFGKFFDIKSGYGFKASEYVEEGIPLVKIDNVTYGKIKWDNITYLPIDYLEKYPDLILEDGDVLLALNRPITQNKLKIGIIKKEYSPAILYQRVGKIIFKSHSEDNIFAYYNLTNHIYTFVKKSSVGSDQPFISTVELKKLKIASPSLLEQQKIASFLSKVDSKIDLLEKKQELWETYKKGIMQQIFSQKLRFKDENGEDYPDWVEKNMSSFSKFLKGSNLSKDDLTDSGFPCVLYGDLFTIYNEVIFQVENFVKNRMDNLLMGNKGDILLPSSTTVDAWSIACSSALMVDDVALGGDINVCRPDLNLVNPVFISYQINQSAKKDIAKLAQGTTIIHLYNHQLKNVKLKIPYIEEQQKIANLMVLIDSKIKLLNNEIELSNKFKNGLLQQMFC